MRPSEHPTGCTGDEVRRLFDRIAPRYDFLDHALSFGQDFRWRRLLADAVLRELARTVQRGRGSEGPHGEGPAEREGPQPAHRTPHAANAPRAGSGAGPDGGPVARSSRHPMRPLHTAYASVPADSAATADPQFPVILDLCCGTGDMTLELARPERGFASVIACDFSEAMLGLLVRKVADAGVRARVLPCAADALCVPFGDATFDAVTVTFGIRNLAEADWALREMRRVLRPGGVLGVLEFLRPRRTAWSAVGSLFRRRVLPHMAAALGGARDAYRYLPETIDAFDGAEEFTARLARAGFVVTGTRELSFGIVTMVVGMRV